LDATRLAVVRVRSLRICQISLGRPRVALTLAIVLEEDGCVFAHGLMDPSGRHFALSWGNARAARDEDRTIFPNRDRRGPIAAGRAVGAPWDLVVDGIHDRLPIFRREPRRMCRRVQRRLFRGSPAGSLRTVVGMRAVAAVGVARMRGMRQTEDVDVGERVGWVPVEVGGAALVAEGVGL
jgi:hypothetical protein